jgi:hypothetical protein
MIPKASDRLAQHGTASATLNAFSREAMFAAFRSEFGDLELGDRGGGGAKVPALLRPRRVQTFRCALRALSPA